MRPNARLCLMWALIAGPSSLALAQEGAPIRPDEGIPIAGAETAHKLIGRKAFVFGTVVQIEPKRSVTLLRFADAEPTDFSAVIRKKQRAAFAADLDSLSDISSNLRAAEERVSRAWDGRSKRDAMIAAKKFTKSERDHRRNRR